MHTSKHEFFRYTLLSMLGMIGLSCYILADTFFVARALGEDGLTALNLAVPMYSLIHGAGLMFGMGGATRFAVCKAEGAKQRGNAVFTLSVRTGGWFSAAVFLCGIVAACPLAIFLGANADTLSMTITYLQILMLFAPAFVYNDILNCFVRNDGNPRLAMASMLVGSFANIILDYILIFPLQMGIFGAVFATGLSPVISICLLSRHRLSKRATFRFLWRGQQTETLRHIVSLGFSSFAAQLSSGVVMIFLNYLILGIAGNTGVAAYGIVANFSFVMLSLFTGLAQGIQPLVSAAYGGGEIREAGRLMKYAIVMVLGISFLMYGILCVFADPLVSVFNKDHVRSLQRLATEGIRLFFLSAPFAGCNLILIQYFAATMQGRPSQILSMLRGFFLIIPLAVLLARVFGMRGVWLAYPLTELITAMLGCREYRKNKS